MTDTERNNFINTNKHDISFIEKRYTNEINKKEIFSKQKCKSLRSDYVFNCEKSEILSKIREFFDDNWYKNMKNEIDNIHELSKTKESLLRIKHFYALNKLNLDLHEVNDELFGYITKCIDKRIKYKFKCIDEKNRDSKHDAEILRHEFYKEKYHQLRKLFIKIQRKHLEIKKKEYNQLYIQKQKLFEKERELLEDDLQFGDLTLSSDKDSNDFQPVTYKKRKRTRIKKH